MCRLIAKSDPAAKQGWCDPLVWSGDEAGVLSDDQLEVPEGAGTRAEITRYELDPNVRQRCLERDDYTSHVCSLKFEQRYGAFASGFNTA